MRLNGLRGDRNRGPTYTVLDSPGLRVVGEIRGRDDGRFAARVARGTPEAVFETVPESPETLSRATRVGFP